MSKPSSPTEMVELKEFHDLPIEKRADVAIRLDSPVGRPRTRKFVKDDVVDIFRHIKAPEAMLERALEHLEEVGEDPDSMVSSFIISTASIDRMDDTISVEGWEMDNFRANPVVPFNHSRYNGDLSGAPVGRDIGAFKGDGALYGVTRFANKDMSPLGHSIGLMVKNGLLNATSVGFRALEYEIAEDRDDGKSWIPPINFTKTELLEYSIVTVPANQDCLVVARGLGIDVAPIRQWAEKLLETDSGILVNRQVLEDVAREGKTIILPPNASQEEEKNMSLKDASAEDLLAELRERGLAPVEVKQEEQPKNAKVESEDPDAFTDEDFAKLLDEEFPAMVAKSIDYIQTTEGSDG